MVYVKTSTCCGRRMWAVCISAPCDITNWTRFAEYKCIDAVLVVKVVERRKSIVPIQLVETTLLL